MAKYIDADVVITSLTDLREKYAEVINHNITYDNIVRAGTVEGILSVLREYPAADVQEVKHGRWLMTDGYPHKVYCSECYATLVPNVEWFKTYNIASNYCPNCGASMVNEDD